MNSDLARPLRVSLLGLGVVGSGVAAALIDRGAYLADRIGRPIELRHVLVRDPARSRATPIAADLLTTDPAVAIEDPAIDVVIEVIGGEHPALNYLERALQAGKHVVTANKEVIAKHGPHLVKVARSSGRSLRYEASVGGGIPIVEPFKRDFRANRIRSFHAIINGTTNYILTQMANSGRDFADALAEAQALGYAEPDPTNDIAGIDAAFKLSILASLGFRTYVPPEAIFREGIAGLTGRDFRYARELGYAIKLLAIGRLDDSDPAARAQVEARVHPTLVPLDFLLAKVDGVFNAVQVEGDLTGRQLFYGRGAGAAPTASAILADLLNLAARPDSPAGPNGLEFQTGPTVKPMADLLTRYYVRMHVLDRAGVLAHVTRVLGDHSISIASVIQKEADLVAGTAEIVIMTHDAQEANMQNALAELRGLPVVTEIGTFLRVES